MYGFPFFEVLIGCRRNGWFSVIKMRSFGLEVEYLRYHEYNSIELGDDPRERRNAFAPSLRRL